VSLRAAAAPPVGASWLGRLRGRLTACGMIAALILGSTPSSANLQHSSEVKAGQWWVRPASAGTPLPHSTLHAGRARQRCSQMRRLDGARAGAASGAGAADAGDSLPADAPVRGADGRCGACGGQRGPRAGGRCASAEAGRWAGLGAAACQAHPGRGRRLPSPAARLERARSGRLPAAAWRAARISGSPWLLAQSAGGVACRERLWGNPCGWAMRAAGRAQSRRVEGKKGVAVAQLLWLHGSPARLACWQDTEVAC
jgi:hypothetical protein